MKQIVIYSILLLLCSCNRATSIYFEDMDDLERDITSIQHLKTLSTQTTTPITQDLKLLATITATDRLGEFEKMIVVEDQTCAITIEIDDRNINDAYPLNSRVMVYCNGLALGSYGGKISLGALPSGEYSIDRIPSNEVLKYIKVIDFETTPLTPLPTTIPELNHSYIDRYVSLQSIKFEESTLTTWCDVDQLTGEPFTTTHNISDSRGNTLKLRTSGSCSYAKELRPKGIGALNGIIDYFNGKYYIQVVNHEVYF